MNNLIHILAGTGMLFILLIIAILISSAIDIYIAKKLIREITNPTCKKCMFWKGKNGIYGRCDLDGKITEKNASCKYFKHINFKNPGKEIKQ